MAITVNRPKTLLLDFDGTLVDSMPTLEQVYLTFLAQHNVCGTKQGFNELMGSTLSEIVSSLKTKHNLSGELEELSAFYEDTLLSFYTNSVLPCLGAQALLDFATNEEIITAIVSSSPHKFINACVSSHKWKKYFNHIVSADDVSFSKPHPHVYLAALEKTNSRPNDALAIEDTINGILSAHAAQIPVIAIDGNNENRELFRQAGAAAVVNNLNEVLDLLSANAICTVSVTISV